MESAPPDPGGTLVCVPTALELGLLERLAPDLAGAAATAAPALVGFGPVAAAARTAALLARTRPARVLLLGIAGAYPGGPGVGEAAEFGGVALDGVGAGEGPGRVLPSAMGLAQWEDERGRVDERLPLGGDGPLLVTVCSAAGTAATAEDRAERFPGAAAEDMEAFGVALAAHLAGIPVRVVRGISNVAGDRDRSRWRVEPALAAAAGLARAILEEASA